MTTQQQPAAQILQSILTPIEDIEPFVVDVVCPTAEEVVITYAPSADSSAMTAKAIEVLRTICSRACIRSVTVTSTARSVEDQARIMYANIRQQGASRVRQLYAAGGRAVVDEYEAASRLGLSPTEIQAAMARRINIVGPENVSHHIAQQGVCTFDVAPSSIAADARPRFVSEAQAHTAVVEFFQPPRDPAYHLEVQ